MTSRLHLLFIDLLPGKKAASHIWFLVYAALYLAFSLNILPVNIVLGMIALAFLTAPMEVMPFLYFFSLPWMYVARFDFGLTLSLIQSVGYLGRVFMARQTLKFTTLEVIVLLYLIGEGIFGFLRESTTLFSSVFYFLIVCHVRNVYFRNPSDRHVFLQDMLFSVMVSVGIAAIYGFVNGTTLARYISGLGYSSQMYGTMGTTRFAMYLFIALLYPLYFVHNKKWKMLLCVLGSAGVIATVSLTALVILAIVWSWYFVASGGKWRTLLLVGGVGFIVLLSGALLWNKISESPFLSPMALRVEQTIERLKTGDVDTATSGRAELFDVYWTEYANATLSEQCFGTQSVRFESNMQFSHNSYLDMLNSIGLLGALLIACLQISRIREYFTCPERHPLLLLKLVVLLTAASVSIFSAQFWQVFLYF